MKHNTPLARPDINEADIEAVVAVLKSSRLSLGPKLNEFEQDFASYIGTKHAVAVSSGTAALHLCIRALEIKDGDEVITSPFSFIASSNCILFERAQPVFVDVLPGTLCIDPAKIEAAITPKTKAILGVDILGYLAEWDAIKVIAEKHGLLLIEDSCEAIGTTKDGKLSGTFADCGVFAFYPNKQITTGEGGMVVTDDEKIATAVRSMRNQGRNEESKFLSHDRLGYNYRISDINCALGISQLKRLPEFIQKRSAIFDWYEESLATLVDLVRTPMRQSGVEVSWFVYVVHLADRFGASDRNHLISYLKENGIGCNKYFPSIHLQSFYRDMFGYKEGAFPVSESASSSGIALPFYSNLSQEEVVNICNVLHNGINSLL
ncbi:MAG: DegT/DnrJ/EryC1/StrS family aminotransferase [Kiritimatiellales bacterium]|nr:DegT/DnrJ/EryC1/StrS family aminotransferase [Kiritimatiellales bacterium]